MNKKNKKIWITPEIKIITGFDVHENVVAESEIPLDFLRSSNKLPDDANPDE